MSNIRSSGKIQFSSRWNDGNETCFDIDYDNNDVTIHVKVKSCDRKEVPQTIKVQKNDLPELIQILKQINRL